MRGSRKACLTRNAPRDPKLQIEYNHGIGFMKLSLLVLLVAGAAVAQTQNPFASDAAAADTGRGMFRIYCANCHGIKGQGARGPDLRSTQQHDDQQLFATISKGSPGTEMRSFDGTFDDAGIWRLITFIRSISKPDDTPLTGDPGNGEKLFWGKGGCGGCHRVNGRGGRLGPDLTKAGRTRARVYLRESISNPDEEIADGYGTVSVVTRDGRKITGVEHGFDNFTVQLMDSSENFHSFERSEVQSVNRENRSLMPRSSLSDSEIDDVIAWLVQLGAAKAKK
jgi:putative heme-binding domain-containing protein